jgi:hypothetical protein
MVAVPFAMPLASPPVLTLTIEGLEDNHVALEVTLEVVPSVSVAVAFICNVPPGGRSPLLGVTVIDVGAGPVTVTGVEPLVPP